VGLVLCLLFHISHLILVFGLKPVSLLARFLLCILMALFLHATLLLEAVSLFLEVVLLLKLNSFWVLERLCSIPPNIVRLIVALVILLVLTFAVVVWELGRLRHLRDQVFDLPWHQSRSCF
jgi:hypothetical protein